MLVICLIIYLLLGPLGQAHAEIRLSEVYPAPAQGFEWVELCNGSDDPISLVGYTLQDGTGKPLHVPQITLEPDQYVLATSSGVLNNGGDTVYLRKDGTIIETMIYSVSVGSSESFVSCDAVWTATTDVTPGFQNPLCGEEDVVGVSGTPVPTVVGAVVVPTVKPGMTIQPTGTARVESEGDEAVTDVPPSKAPSPQLFSQKHQPRVKSVRGVQSAGTPTPAPTDIVIPVASSRREVGMMVILILVLISGSASGYAVYQVVQRAKASYNETHEPSPVSEIVDT